LTDIFREIDEAVRHEQLKKLWERHGIYLVALAFVLVLGIAGWRGYAWWEARKAAEAGAAFESAIALADAGKPQDAEAALARLAAEGTSGYRKLARLREAALLAQHDPKAAVAAYDAIATDPRMDKELRDLAALRAGFLLLDGAPLDEMQRRLEPLTGPKNTFRHSARELLALAAWRAGDMAAARRWSQLIMTDAETPVSVRARIEMLMVLLGTSSQS
jgi:hypothetical protein